MAWVFVLSCAEFLKVKRLCRLVVPLLTSKLYNPILFVLDVIVPLSLGKVGLGFH